jgi:hypothetical protein
MYFYFILLRVLREPRRTNLTFQFPLKERKSSDMSDEDLIGTDVYFFHPKYVLSNDKLMGMIAYTVLAACVTKTYIWVCTNASGVEPKKKPYNT